MLDVTAQCQGRVTSRYDEAGWDDGSLVADADTPELPLVPLLDESAPCVESVLLPRYGGVDEVQVDVLCIATVQDVLEEGHIEDVLTETEFLVRLVHAPQRAFVPEIGVVYLRRCARTLSDGRTSRIDMGIRHILTNSSSRGTPHSRTALPTSRSLW